MYKNLGRRAIDGREASNPTYVRSAMKFIYAAHVYEEGIVVP